MSTQPETTQSEEIPNPTLLLSTHILGKYPQLLLDDIINCVQDASTKVIADFENDAEKWIYTSSSLAPPKSSQSAVIGKTTEEEQLEFEREKVKDEAVSAMESLVNSAVDQVFDVFERYFEKNFLLLPELSKGGVTLPEFENLSLSVTQQEINEKRERLSQLLVEYREKMEDNAYLNTINKEYEDMLPALRKSVDQIKHLTESIPGDDSTSVLEATSMVSSTVKPLRNLSEKTLQRTIMGGNPNQETNLEELIKTSTFERMRDTLNPMASTLKPVVDDVSDSNGDVVMTGAGELEKEFTSGTQIAMLDQMAEIDLKKFRESEAGVVGLISAVLETLMADLVTPAQVGIAVVEVEIKDFRRVSSVANTIGKLSEQTTSNPIKISRNLEPLTLRPYQKKCVKICLNAFEGGMWRQAVSLPVGSGKSYIYTKLMKQVVPVNSTATKVLIVLRREELVDKVMDIVMHEFPPSKIGKELENADPIDVEKYDVIVSSSSALVNKISSRLENYDPNKFKMVIFDETQWNRNDERNSKLSKMFQSVVYEKSLVDLIEEGWLCKIKLSTINTSVNLTGTNIIQNDFATSDLGPLINTPERNTTIIHNWTKVAFPHKLTETAVQKVINSVHEWKDRDAGDSKIKKLSRINAVKLRRKRTVVFAGNLQHVKVLTKGFWCCGVESVAYVFWEIPKKTRVGILKMFAEGKISVLITCDNFLEGVDVSNIDCVVLARPTISSTRLQQMVGRGLLPHPDKDYCHVLSFQDNLDGDIKLATIPTLLGLSSSFSYEGRFDYLYKRAIPVMERLNSMKSPPECIDLQQLQYLFDLLNAPKISAPLTFDKSIPDRIQQEIKRDTEFFSKQNSKNKVEIKFPDSFKLFDYDGMKDDAKVLRQVTDLHWVRVGEYCFAMGMKGRSVYKIKRVSGELFGNTEDTYELYERNPLTNQARQLMTGNLQSCMNGCKIYLQKTKIDYMADLGRTAKWRTLLCIPTQLRFLQELNIVQITGTDPIPYWKWKDRNGMIEFVPITKGVASDLILQYSEHEEKRENEILAEELANKVFNLVTQDQH
ncbi:hypothetical protein HK098_007543 [Nowakowskiella sp. JEL0407]|nr:hypothetical protein HK098_007543 [Nowakowskiella sp. JEL0407]